MLRFSTTLTLATLVLLAATAGADVYKYVDEKGNVQYTDKPATLPAERLNVQSQKTDTVAAQQRADADVKRIQDADKARNKTANQQSDQSAASELSAKDKAERCIKARERYDTAMNSRRLYQPGDNGERRYLSDAEIDAARNSAKVSMDELCK
jgi:hypothetical protein